MTLPEEPSFWRRMPPAVFPPLLGLFGLGLAWRRAEAPFGLPSGLGDLILGAVTLLYLFTLLAYAAKLLRRPGVVIEDLRVLPGRAGLAAMTVSLMLLAAALVPLSQGLAQAVLFAGLAGHAVLAVLLIRVLVAAPPEARQVTPVWHLAFVGFIVAPAAAAPLGYLDLVGAILAATLLAAGVIYAVSLAQLGKQGPPPPLRPLQAIHLAPMALFGQAAHLLGLEVTAVIFAVFANVVLAVLLWRARYLTKAGFSPLWGAFTFPLAAYSGLMLALWEVSEVFLVLGGLSLITATLIIPAIAAKVLQLWAKGVLAAKTNAAVA